MAQRMVKVQNMVNKTVSVKKPEYGINRRWTQKGQIIPLPYEAVEQMLWDNGVRVMIDRGILYIPDMKDKIDLGLEPEDAAEPENIIVLSDLQINNLLINVPFSVFKREIDKLPETQVREVVNYAILHEIADIQKTDYIGELTGVDILKVISRNKDVKKAETKMNQSENK